MLVLRDGVLPLVDAARAPRRHVPAPDEPTHAVVVRGARLALALAVDRLVGQRELVTRPLPRRRRRARGLSGGAVLSDGQIALIVDCDAASSAPIPPQPGRTS